MKKKQVWIRKLFLEQKSKGIFYFASLFIGCLKLLDSEYFSNIID